ncbi:endonuclease/exonuclease/phosphatase family protein [Falsibacillus albus]|uniref:Endonuclease/exonuclease/phosphatase family protein n=1 Tax=Falsibacillus albus TaxID=2478915 RepID=A0A3L7JUP0_9BACI|nr:endonuclease/exonuclease/phosphatase family protein [Falsibacillus albus]RLQ94015.1 endonuclease/exonuclease/phosphatase family protein [Falsibacillus albus]
MNQFEKIKLMTLNTWLGSSVVKEGISKLVKAVKASGSDIVGFQETPDPGKETALKLGWYFHQNQAGLANCSIISKHPIIEGVDIGGVSAVMVKIQLPSGKVIVVVNTHLYYDPYGPYWAMFNGKTPEEIISMENAIRGAEMAKVLYELSPYIATDIPVFLMGDFNTPSHLDWNRDMSMIHKGLEIDWPVTLMVEKMGLIDSYRAIHPDPVDSPGYTWSPVHTPEFPWGSNPYEPQDRIDFIFFHGNLKVVNSNVFFLGKPRGYGSHEDNEWPSDHAAVISDFHITNSDSREHDRMF